MSKPLKYAIVAPDAKQSEPLRATTSETALRCRSVDVATIAAFHDEWVESIREEQQGS